MKNFNLSGSSFKSDLKNYPKTYSNNDGIEQVFNEIDIKSYNCSFRFSI